MRAWPSRPSPMRSSATSIAASWSMFDRRTRSCAGARSTLSPRSPNSMRFPRAPAWIGRMAMCSRAIVARHGRARRERRPDPPRDGGWPFRRRAGEAETAIGSFNRGPRPALREKTMKSTFKRLAFAGAAAGGDVGRIGGGAGGRAEDRELAQRRRRHLELENHSGLQQALPRHQGRVRAFGAEGIQRRA